MRCCDEMVTQPCEKVFKKKVKFGKHLEERRAMSRLEALWGSRTPKADQILPTTVQTGPNDGFWGQFAPLGEPNWCYMAPHGFACTTIVTK